MARRRKHKAVRRKRRVSKRRVNRYIPKGLMSIFRSAIKSKPYVGGRVSSKKVVSQILAQSKRFSRGVHCPGCGNPVKLIKLITSRGSRLGGYSCNNCGVSWKRGRGGPV